MSSLFDVIQVGNLQLTNRIFMGPMTRGRADDAGVQPAIAAEYYAQRASAGLIVSEGTPISRQGRGYIWTPGIYTSEQVAGWKKVTTAVHHKGGKIFAQLWHVGRVSHTSIQPGGEAPVAPSPVVAEGVKVFADVDGTGIGQMVQHSMPRALTIPEIHNITQEFVRAAENAIGAGFDGVELHGANGYIFAQFMDSHPNQRTDEYGGSLENRLRFLKETVTAVANAIGKERVGVRQAPLTTLMGSVDDHPEETYIAAAKVMNEIGIAYIHVAEADWDNAPHMPASFKEAYREAFKGTLIYSGKYTPERAAEAIAKGWGDLFGFGRPFIANPDLPYRLKNNLPLNQPDVSTFFGGGSRGYTDYPFYEAAKVA